MSRTVGNGEGSSGSSRQNRTNSRTLGEAMRAPSTVTPDVVVIDTAYDKKKRKDIPNPREDLWLSSADGRYSAPVVPLRVGQGAGQQVFYVHLDVLVRCDYFQKAFCGPFKEAQALSMDLPEEDPSIFHFVVAFLYQGTFVPIRSVASVLQTETENGKGRDNGHHHHSDSDGWSSSDESAGSETSLARSRRLSQRRARRAWERAQQKRPGSHRPGCRCPRCMIPQGGAPCWNCGIAPIRPRPMPPPYWNYPPPPPAFPPVGYPGAPPGDRHRRHRRDRQRGLLPPGVDPRDNRPGAHRHHHHHHLPPSASSPEDEGPPRGRIHGEDMRTWLQTYTLSLEVYICACKFLMDDFKAVIRSHVVDMLETAGPDAAVPEVLRLCGDLWIGVPESDELLKMVFARIGFLQPLLWQRAPEETSSFLIGNPEVSTLILREAAVRREADLGNQSSLPSMESLPPIPGMGPPPPLMPGMVPGPNYGRPYVLD
ncbi:hypothetical protein B0T11DRAFT_22459 [Plectosphaerella cucumerina]|uniref:BTB domain-containing protein n=1 Tax=Plectosphaerella cucumerina TaxID=40658 RepID=A0A8K0XAJ6_9PEZI|nr:hypothetical protein B0T11DRAFT_22459 [Plectosphaerella cucumerina]